ncbi:hypothetical protein ON010_g760 [Phytophthora cinnamomi]|nr:hypothetical protein ON010_g760 [Phytophthora cinnamomi]
MVHTAVFHTFILGWVLPTPCKAERSEKATTNALVSRATVFGDFFTPQPASIMRSIFDPEDGFDLVQEDADLGRRLSALSNNSKHAFTLNQVQRVKVCATYDREDEGGATVGDQERAKVEAGAGEGGGGTGIPGGTPLLRLPRAPEAHRQDSARPRTPALVPLLQSRDVDYIDRELSVKVAQ